ncbi:MAG: transcriptional regulator [Flavobacteriia bacterium]|nr:transcriptional regulator [Flavobacteriia bacterium]
MKSAVLIGDIVNSTESSYSTWQAGLKSILSEYTESSVDWEIYRGDSFQAKVDVNKIMMLVLEVKAFLKSVDKLDARMAIGIGEVNPGYERLAEASGDALVRAGRLFEETRSGIRIDSGVEGLDESLNITLDLLAFIVENWTQSQAELILHKINHPHLKQTRLAESLGISQGTLSQRLSRTGIDRVQAAIDYIHAQIR